MALTMTTTLTQEVQDALSAELLMQVDDAYVFYASGPIQHSDEDAREPGTNVINFNRPTLPTGTFTEVSRRLTEGTPVDTTGVSIAMTQVSLTTREYGGPHDGTAVRPFGVSEFFKNRSKHNALELLGEFLRRDRSRFLDTTTLNLLLAATTVITPDGSTSGTIAAGQGASIAWLQLMNKSMKDRKVPTYPNGRWRLMLSTQDEMSLKRDPDYKEAMRYLAGANPIFNGHVGSIEGFDIGVNTQFSTSAVGAGGLVTGYNSVAWGPFGIGHGISLDPSVRRADDTDFGRQEKMIWKSEEAIGTLYADMLTAGLTS